MRARTIIKKRTLFFSIALIVLCLTFLMRFSAIFSNTSNVAELDLDNLSLGPLLPSSPSALPPEEQERAISSFEPERDGWLSKSSGSAILSNTFNVAELDLDNLSLGPLLPSSPSTLLPEEQEKAISFFESQRDSWLSIKTGSARFETSTRTIKGDEYFEDKAAESQTGLIEFLVEPLPQEDIGDLSPVKIRAHMLNDKGWNFVKENVFDPEEETKEWAIYDFCPLEGDLAQLVRKTFCTELLFFPFDFMSKTFQDEVWRNRYTAETKEQFFEERGIPWRRSTSEEDSQLFNGESHYLFMISPTITGAHYWFNRENGELRRVDVFLPGNVVKSFQYEDYYQYKNQTAKYPRKLKLIWKKGRGESTIGWEFSMRLTNVALNIDIPEDNFSPPE